MKKPAVSIWSWTLPNRIHFTPACGIAFAVDGAIPFRKTGIIFIKTWKIIDKARPDDSVGRGLPDTKFTGRIGLAVSHSNPNIVYAFVDDHEKKRDPKPGETDSYERQVQKVV